MDMYQKRRMRKEKREQNEGQNQNGTRTCISCFPGHMSKTRRLIKEKLNLIDIVYEVIDARVPKSSRIIDIDSLLRNKPRIIIMTKYDLCDRVRTNKWVKHYEEKGYKVITTDLINTNDTKKIIDASVEVLTPTIEKRINKGLLNKKHRVLVVGIPNVGKSTLINKLAGKKVVTVGNRPGVTKNLEWIRINEKLELLDSPGILWPKFEDMEVAYNLASLTAIKQEVLPTDEVAIYILNKMAKLYPNLLKQYYKIENHNEDDIMATFEHLGRLRGCLIKGGEVDIDKVVLFIINDLKDGKIKGITFDDIK